ncbi:MAG: hypothetical protein K9K88_00045 [Desulfobacterales bacterium]|nr:hypothetical protein [Desulfobacterales bacterium]
MRVSRRWVVSVFVLPIVALLLFAADLHAWGRGAFYVIGTGPAGPQTATLQALETIRRMDVIIAPEKHVRLFSEYVGDKPVAFDPWTGFWDYKGKSSRELNDEEKAAWQVERFRIRDERVAKIKELLAEGKNVGLLDSGNPNLFGPSHWYSEHFDPSDLVIIPGMGCDAAAMAALKKSTIPAHDVNYVLQSAPFLLSDRALEDMTVLEDIARHRTTMILYMALQQPETLFARLGEVLPADMPCAVVFWAGYPDRERVVRGTVADMGEKLADEKERFMGLLFVGRFLEGKPYEASMKRHQYEGKNKKGGGSANQPKE